MDDGNRASLLHQNDISQRVKTMQELMQSFKKKQYIGGDSIRFYKSDSGAAYDWTGQALGATQTPTSGSKLLTVEATALTQNVLFADLIAELYVDNMSARHTILDYNTERANNVDSFDINFFKNPVPLSSTNKASWTVFIIGSDPQAVAKPPNTLFTKFYILANDEVTISVT